MVCYAAAATLPAMTGAELRTAREQLGVTGDWLAEYMGEKPRTLRRWEQGLHRVPDKVRSYIEHLERRTADVVAQMADTLNRDREQPVTVVAVYRTNAQFHAAHPDLSLFCASWHRVVVARVAQQVPGLRMVYADHDGGPST